MQHSDTTERIETETKSAVIADDCSDDKTVSFTQSHPIIEDLRSNDEKASLDWNANKSTEISSIDRPGDVNAAPDKERAGDEQESRVCFSTDAKSTSEEVIETHDGNSDSVAVAVVTASPSYAAPPMNDSLNDDAPPPLPTSLPPSLSEFPPLDTSQNLSVVVEDGPQSTAEVFCPPSSYANSVSDTSPTEMDSSSVPATEQSHSEGLGQEDSTDKYSELSEEDRLLVERILATAKERQTSAVEETTAAGPTLAGNCAENESEEKYSELSEPERKLIENTLASLKHRQLDVHNDTEPELSVRDDNDRDMNTYDLGKKNVSSIETEIQQLPQNEDQQPDRATAVNIDYVSAGAGDESVSSTQTKIQESSEDQEPHRNTSEEVGSGSRETTVAEEVKTCELTVRADQTCTATSPPDALKTSDSTLGSVENYEDQIVVVPSEIKDTTAAESEEPESAKHLMDTVIFPADDVNTAKEKKSGPVNAEHENYSEPAVVVQAQVNVDAASEGQNISTATDTNSKSTKEVFHSGSGNVPSDAQSSDADTDVLAKSRRTILSDEAVSEIMRDYYTADVEPQVEEQKPEKPKPVKPLIAKALLPKASRHPVGTLSSGSSTTVDVAPTSSQTSNNSGKLRYGQVEIPRAVTASQKSEARAAEDSKSLKPLTGQDTDNVTRDDVMASRGPVSEPGMEPNIGAAKSTNSDEKRADGRDVPTVAESRAFFKSREAALKNSSDKSSVILPYPIAESSSTTAVHLTHATSLTSSRDEDGETQSVKAPLPQRSSQSLPSTWTESSRRIIQSVVTNLSQAEVRTSRKSEPLETIAATSSGKLEVTGSSQEVTSTTTSDTISTMTTSLPVTSSSWTTANIQTSLEVHTEPPKLTDAGSIGSRKGSDSGVTSTSRVPLTTRWAPKPFSLTTTTTKSTPRFMTFEPMLLTAKIPETTEPEVPTDKPVAKVESDPSINDYRKTDAETASTEKKPKLGSSESSTITAGAGGSVEGSSATDEDECTSKSSDVEVDAVGSTDVADISVICQTAEPQSPRDKHHPLSAAAMATELKKMGVRSPTRTGPVHLHTHNLSGLGRSSSMSQADVPPKSDQAVVSNGCKSTNRGPPTLAKSWTQFDYRKTGGGQYRSFSREANEDVEHLDVASSKAFFRAAEQAQKQALNQPEARIISRKSALTSGVRVVASAKDDEQRSAATAETDVSSSTDSPVFTDSAPAAIG